MGGIEKWLAITSVGLFAMFVGEILSIYNFMINVPESFEFARSFEADPKLIQFISIGAAPAGILAAVSFIMSKQYGSKLIGVLIIAGGVILLAGMLVTYTLIDKIDEIYITPMVLTVPVLFMALSFAVIGVGASLIIRKKRRPKKEYF